MRVQFSHQLLSTVCAPGTVLATKDTAVSKIDKNHCPLGACNLVMEMDNKQDKWWYGG